MFSKKIMMSLALALAALSMVLICAAYAQWIPASTEINLGDFKLTSSSSNAGTGVYQIGSGPMNIIPTNSSLMTKSPTNSTPVTNTQPAMINLTGYARDRLRGNLTGYTNIMYPFGESRGSTATTAGGGCGCG